MTNQLVVITDRSCTGLAQDELTILEAVEGQHGFLSRAVGEVGDSVLDSDLVILEQDAMVLHGHSTTA